MVISNQLMVPAVSVGSTRSLCYQMISVDIQGLLRRGTRLSIPRSRDLVIVLVMLVRGARQGKVHRASGIGHRA